jgi:two-component system LytT family sensor kinase
MKFSKPNKIELYGFLISMPVIAIVLNSILFKEHVFDVRVWLISFPLLHIVGVASWYLHIQYDHLIRKKFPELNQTKKRIFFKVFTNVFVMTPSVLVIFFLYNYFHILNYHFQMQDFLWGYFVGLSVNLVFDTLWEVLYCLEKYKENLSSKEMLGQLNTEHAFENLKSQLNPHFLFNCFNTLSSLIQEDKKEAENFLDELSKVYRYLLKTNEDSISTVEKEVHFIESYYRLLKTRYGDGLHINFNIDKKFYAYLVPSLSLQLLVENAVKHNIVSKQHPLIMDIFTTTGNKLVVNNNLQKKQLNIKSTNIGLKNISMKYKLMKQTDFQVIEGKNNFMVVLPMVWNETSPQPLSKGEEQKQILL